jgi:hypothetical protein
MRKVTLVAVLTVLVVTLFPMAAMSLPILGTCQGCSVWYDEYGIPSSSCDDTSQRWASCSAIVYCERDNLGHLVNCVPECTGSRCYQV